MRFRDIDRHDMNYCSRYLELGQETKAYKQDSYCIHVRSGSCCLQRQMEAKDEIQRSPTEFSELFFVFP